jgi:hypothetical protein
MVEVIIPKQSGVGTIWHDPASFGSVSTSRVNRPSGARHPNVTVQRHASRAEPGGNARAAPLRCTYERAYQAATKVRSSPINGLGTQTAQPTVETGESTNVAAAATRYPGGGDAGPAGCLSGCASATTASACPPDQGGAGGHTGADRPTDQPTERPPLTYRVWANHYLCDACPLEWEETAVCAGPSFCPCCDRERQPYASIDLLEDA